MKVLPVVFNPNYHINGWETNHRFPMPKYQLLYQLLVEEGICDPKKFHQASPAPRNALERVHLPSYLDDFLAGHIMRSRIMEPGFASSMMFLLP